MAERRNTNEIARLQSEIANEVARDGPEIATMVFGEAKDQPDVVTVQNERLDQVYRDAYQRNDRTWLQGEARRNPEQFLKVAQRIGVQVPQVAPGMQSPVPSPGAFARTASAAPALPAPPPPPNAPVMPPVAVPPPVVVPQGPPIVPPPVILGPNGQPLPPSGAF